MAWLQKPQKLMSYVEPETQYGGRKEGYAIEILPKSGRFT